MATFKALGFEGVETMLLNQVKIAKEAVPKMLNAAADVIIRAHKAEAEAMGLKDTGALISSIGIYKQDIRDTSAVIIIAPKGKDKKGVRNIEKGAILEYGITKGKRNKKGRINTRNLTARQWMSKANDKIEDRVYEVMLDIWEKMSNE